MNILLINPPNIHEIISNNPEIIEQERGHNPPLGLLYIAGYVQTFSEHSVQVIDCQVQEITYPKLKNHLDNLNFDIVGITAMTFTLLDVIETIHIVKKSKPHVKIVLGGPHPHLFPNETIGLKDVDFLVIGEGEETFLKLINHIDEFEILKSIKGLVFKYGNETINTGIPPFINNLDQIPFPARHLTPYQKYDSILAPRSPVTIIMTSRGCPYQCTFCDRPQLGKLFRARSVNNVVDELELCMEMGIHEFIFYDDTFTVKLQRAKDICDEIVKRKLDIGWDIRARVDTIDEELLKKLKQAGCRGIHYGVEAGTEKILKVLNKGISLQQVEEVFKLTKKTGLMTLAYFMIGNPSGTKDDILKTFKFSKKIDADYIHMTILTPFPGTKIYFDALKKKVINTNVWKEFAINPSKSLVPPHWNENFKLDELQKLLKYGYKCFYLRPLYIIKRIVKIQTWNELWRKIKAAGKVVIMK